MMTNSDFLRIWRFGSRSGGGRRHADPEVVVRNAAPTVTAPLRGQLAARPRDADMTASATPCANVHCERHKNAPHITTFHRPLQSTLT